MRFDMSQSGPLARLLHETPWEDVRGAIDASEEALRRAMEVTAEDFRFWEDHAEEFGYDEFALEPWDMGAMSEQWRCAFVARLLRSFALHFGVGTEYGGELGLPIMSHRDALAPLLHDLVEFARQPSWYTLYPGVAELSRSLQSVAVASERQRRWYLLRAERQAEELLEAIRRDSGSLVGRRD